MLRLNAHLILYSGVNNNISLSLSLSLPISIANVNLNTSGRPISRAFIYLKQLVPVSRGHKNEIVDVIMEISCLACRSILT